MERLSSVSIINDKNLRGIVGPPSSISREMLEDMLDLIGYANRGISSTINRRFKKTEGRVDGKKLRTSLAAA